MSEYGIGTASDMAARTAVHEPVNPTRQLLEHAFQSVSGQIIGISQLTDEALLIAYVQNEIKADRKRRKRVKK